VRAPPRRRGRVVAVWPLQVGAGAVTTKVAVLSVLVEAVLPLPAASVAALAGMEAMAAALRDTGRPCDPAPEWSGQ
jgi:hypothetical protein